MKHFLLVIFFIVICNLSFAQDSSEVKKDELKHGLQFQVGNLLNLDNFNSYTFSYRYRLNNTSGIRAGLLIDVRKDDSDIIQKRDSVTLNPPQFYNNYSYKISAQYLHRVMNYKKFALLIGGGPFVSYSKNESESQSLGSSIIYKYKNKSKSTGFGLDIIFGVEYELAENVLLSGEYGLTIERINSDIDNSTEYIYDVESLNRIISESGTRNISSIKGIGVNLGIAIFF